MAVCFSDRERTKIIQSLRHAAAKHSSLVGMRKTTVDELAVDAGISKGAFYKFYPSKESLFLDVLEQWYQSIYERANQELCDNLDKPPRQRAALVLKAACRFIRATPLVRFCLDDLPIALRRVPELAAQKHYQSIAEFISNMIDRSQTSLTAPKDEVCAVVKILFLSMLTDHEVGDRFQSALDGLIDGAVNRYVSEA